MENPPTFSVKVIILKKPKQKQKKCGLILIPLVSKTVSKRSGDFIEHYPIDDWQWLSWQRDSLGKLNFEALFESTLQLSRSH